MKPDPAAVEAARAAMEESDAFRRMVDELPLVVYIDANDEASSSLYISPQVEEMLGYTPTQWAADSDLWYRVMHVDDRDRVLEESNRCNAAGEPFRTEYRMHAFDGTEHWIRDEAIPVRDAQGRTLFWRGIMLDITDLKRAESKLRRTVEANRVAMEERKMLLGRLEQAREAERKSIAADVHDDSIQIMAAVSLRLQMLEPVMPSDKRPAMNELIETVNDAVERLRHLVFELRPPALDEEGLAAALTEYLEEMSRQGEYQFRVHDVLTAEPTGESRIVLYRISQEAIGNITKHAHARHVSVYLETEGQGVTVRIVDDGAGFDVSRMKAPEPGHLGLIAMRERSELVGGNFTLESTPGVGTTVEFWLPAVLEAPATQSAPATGSA